MMFKLGIRDMAIYTQVDTYYTAASAFGPNEGRIKRRGPQQIWANDGTTHHLHPWQHGHKLRKGHKIRACGCVVVYVFPKYDWETHEHKSIC